MAENLSLNEVQPQKGQISGPANQKDLGTLLKRAMAVSKKAMQGDDIALLEQAICLWHEVLEISPNSPIARRHLQSAEEKRNIMQAALLWNESVLDRTQQNTMKSANFSSSILEELRKAARSSAQTESNLKKQLLLWQKIIEILPVDQEATEQIKKIEEQIKKHGIEAKQPVAQSQVSPIQKKTKSLKASKEKSDSILRGDEISEVSHLPIDNKNVFLDEQPSLIPISPLDKNGQNTPAFLHGDLDANSGFQAIERDQFFFSNDLEGDSSGIAKSDREIGFNLESDLSPLNENEKQNHLLELEQGELPSFQALNGDGKPSRLSEKRGFELGNDSLQKRLELSLPPIEDLLKQSMAENQERQAKKEDPGQLAGADVSDLNLASALINTTYELSELLDAPDQPKKKLKKKAQIQRRHLSGRNSSWMPVLGITAGSSLAAMCFAMMIFGQQIQILAAPYVKNLGVAIFTVSQAMKFLQNRDIEIPRIKAQRELDLATRIFENNHYERALKHCQNVQKISIPNEEIKREISKKNQEILMQIHSRYTQLGEYYEKRGWRYREKAIELYELALKAHPLDFDLVSKVYKLKKATQGS